MENNQDLTPAKADGPSQISPYPAIPRSESLEDGEIVEGRFFSISLQSPQQQSPKGQPGPPTANHVKASTPPLVAFPIALGPAPAAAAFPARPTEPMTREDLDRAKSLVLDLLGWGVTPEYLLECGLSPSTIYTIFTDLRLRLPTNLDTSFPPPSYHTAQ